MNHDIQCAVVPYFGKSHVEGPLPRFNRTEKMFVGFSVRNRSFSKDFFQKAIKLMAGTASKGRIAIFDYPYSYNDAALRGENNPMRADIMKNKKIGDQKERMVEKVRTKLYADTIEIVRWELFCNNPVIKRIRDEFSESISVNNTLRKQLMEQALSWLEKTGRVDEESFLNFQIQEIPVLIYLYYFEDWLIDIYPGENFEIFKQIEAGAWSSELPYISNISMNKKLCFISV